MTLSDNLSKRFNFVVCIISLSLGLALSACRTDDQMNSWSPTPLGQSGGPSLEKTAGGAPMYASAGGGASAAGALPQPLYYQGTGQMVGPNPPLLPAEVDAGKDGVTLNLANASIDVAAKTVLGDILKLDYSIDPTVSGKITIQTSTPIARSELIKLFQNALAANGATIVKTGALFKIETLEQARNSPLGVQVGTGQPGAGQNAGDQIGASMRVVPLRYVSASEMQRILEPMVGKTSIVAADDSRNTITVTGNDQEISSILSTIGIFDVDVMKGMSVLAVSVRASPDAIASDLKGVFGSDKGAMKGMVRFLPNERLKSILVVSSQKAYLAKAEMWIKRLDSRAAGNDKRLFTHSVQNRAAKELVEIVNSMFSTFGSSASASRSVAPRFQTASAGGGAAATDDTDHNQPAPVQDTSTDQAAPADPSGSGIDGSYDRSPSQNLRPLA